MTENVRLNGDDGASCGEWDEELIGRWLEGRNRHTSRAYKRGAKRLSQFLKKPIARATFDDISHFVHSVMEAGSTAATRSTLAALKSLCSFCFLDFCTFF